LKEKCSQISVLREDRGTDDKLHYLTPYLANLTLYFDLYKCILRVIFGLCGPELKSGLPELQNPPPKNMTNMTKPNQALVMSEHEDNPASQDSPDRLTEKKKAEHTMIMFLG